MRPEPEPEIENFHEPTEEERRLASSDLEDCPEIWRPELGSYILDTHKRQRQVDQYFQHWIIVSFKPIISPLVVSLNACSVESRCIDCCYPIPLLRGSYLADPSTSTATSGASSCRRGSITLATTVPFAYCYRRGTSTLRYHRLLSAR